MLNNSQTIYALTTVFGKSGVAVIRISGWDIQNFYDFFKLTKQFQHRRFELVKLFHPKENYLLDQILLVFFQSPHSFTGEDVLELHLHGSKAIIKNLLQLLAKIPNFRLAEPGEFAKRSFFNGKINLTEAEGLADMIEAETVMQHKQASRQFSGELEILYEKWRKSILETNAFIEAYIDFPEEDIPDNLKENIEKTLNQLKSEISTHLDDNKRGEKIREGLLAVIFGPVNAGKSTLINYLAKRDVSIVSNIEGTTRDVIEVNLDLAGYPLTISDTAGLRDSKDIIENEGIKRAISRTRTADLKIALLNYQELDNLDDLILDIIDQETIILINKVDLNLGPPKKNFIKNIEPIYISLKDNINLDFFLEKIKLKLDEIFGETEAPVLSHARYRENLLETLFAIDQFSLEEPIELASEKLRLAANLIGKITGKIEVDEILGVIFSSFCIGK